MVFQFVVLIFFISELFWIFCLAGDWMAGLREIIEMVLAVLI